MRLLEQVELLNILDYLIKRAKSASGDALIKIMLFGSYADGNASPESDIDLLIILESDNPDMVKSVRDASYDLMWNNDFEFIISLHFISKDHYNLIKRANTSFYQEIAKKGVVLWENSREKLLVG